MIPFRVQAAFAVGAANAVRQNARPDVMEMWVPKQETLRPAVQRRSVDASRRMTQAGLELLELRDIDQISIRDIVSAAQTSVGSFYHRYGTKEVFFNQLIDGMIVWRQATAEAVLNDYPVEAMSEALARGVVDNYRIHAGLIRSTIRRHIAGDNCWERISLMGQRIVDAYIERLSDATGQPIDADRRKRIGFVFLWLYGLMSHRVLRLNTIHGYTVSDEVFEEETITNFKQLLEKAIVGLTLSPGRDATPSPVQRREPPVAHAPGRSPVGGRSGNSSPSA